MFGFGTKEEKEAYKAGIRKGEKNAAASNSVNADALASLWAALGADNQTEALDKANYLRETKLNICVNYDKLANEKLELAEQYKNLTDIAIDRLNQIGELRDSLASAELQVNQFASTLSAARAMSSHFRKERDALNDKITALFENVGKVVSKVTGYAYPGVIRSEFTTKAGEIRFVVEATGAEYAGMLHIFNRDQLQFHNEGLSTKGLAAHIQQVGRAMRKVPDAVHMGEYTIKDYAGLGRHDERVNGPDRSEERARNDKAYAAFGRDIAEIAKKHFGDK